METRNGSDPVERLPNLPGQIHLPHRPVVLVEEIDAGPEVDRQVPFRHNDRSTRHRQERVKTENRE